jgi:hypothetical protein
LGAVFTALASLCVDGGVVLKGGTKVDFHNIMNVFTGAGLVVKRDAYVLVRGAMTKTSFVYLARFAPKNANFVVEGLLVTNKELVGLCDAIELELEKKGKTTHGAATENALKELMKSVLRGNGFGWSESDTANKPKIQKLYARVRGKLVADGKVAVITAAARAVRGRDGGRGGRRDLNRRRRHRRRRFPRRANGRVQHPRRWRS